MNKNLSRTATLNDLAAVEQMVFVLERDVEGAGSHRQNQLVCESIENASAELELAFKNLAHDSIEKAGRSCIIAWLYANFARKVVDAEETEYLLGESDYLELAETIDDWKQRIEADYSSLEKAVLKLRADVKARSG